ncbi:MAG: response regulator [Phycisphaerales bacterium]|nr:response regulator [Phycisphaerales bacterium]MCB9854736.1 response regulator [Phycisphaerales bacterium]
MAIKITNDHELVMVDDDEMELVLTERYLRQSKLTNKLLPFSSAEKFLKYLEGVAKGEHRMPALVLMDVRMPTIDGFEAVTLVRRIPQFKTIPIIMMFSNSDAETDIRKALNVGADHYQVKPSNGEEFVEFLNSLA